LSCYSSTRVHGIKASRSRAIVPVWNDAPLIQTGFVEQVRIALAAVGIDARNYAGHSFRSGAATTVAGMGLSESRLGRWQSSAYQLYRSQLADVSRCLVENLQPA